MSLINNSQEENKTEIDEIIIINKKYNKQKNQHSYFLNNNPNKAINYVYCNRNIPYYTSINDKYNRTYYEEKREQFFKENYLNNINNNFINDVFYILDKNNLKVKNEKLLKEDLLHFIYSYSTN